MLRLQVFCQKALELTKVDVNEVVLAQVAAQAYTREYVGFTE